jgi:hypothetical protein
MVRRCRSGRLLYVIGMQRDNGAPAFLLRTRRDKPASAQSRFGIARRDARSAVGMRRVASAADTSCRLEDAAAVVFRRAGEARWGSRPTSPSALPAAIFLIGFGRSAECQLITYGIAMFELFGAAVVLYPFQSRPVPSRSVAISVAKFLPRSEPGVLADTSAPSRPEKPAAGVRAPV